jgi:hypothetical protein
MLERDGKLQLVANTASLWTLGRIHCGRGYLERVRRGRVLREVTQVHRDLEKGHCCNSNPVATDSRKRRSQTMSPACISPLLPSDFLEPSLESDQERVCAKSPIRRGRRRLAWFELHGERGWTLYHANLASTAGVVHVPFPGVTQHVAQSEESRSSTG